MDNETESALRTLFEADQAKRTVTLSEAEQKELQRSRDLETFAVLQEETIAPELEKIAAFVCEHGWDAKVIRDPGSPKDPERLMPPSIGLYILNEGKVNGHRPNEFAHIRFVCAPEYSAVSVAKSDILPSKGGSSTSGGLIKYDRINSAMVSKAATDLLKTLLEK